MEKQKVDTNKHCSELSRKGPKLVKKNNIILSQNNIKIQVSKGTTGDIASSSMGSLSYFLQDFLSEKNKTKKLKFSGKSSRAVLFHILRKIKPTERMVF